VSLCDGGGRRLLVVLACILGLAACGDLPRPFQPADKPLPDIAEEEVGSRAGVFVEAIAGLAEGESERLTEALVTALRSKDVAASRLAQNRASLRISARRGEAGGLRWSLTAPSGETLLGFDEVGGEAGAQRAARLFADFLNPAPPPTAVVSRLAIAVPPVDGAPGDGRSALAGAMRQALAAKGFATGGGLADAAYLVLGSVHVAPAARAAGQETVSVDWAVLAPDGARLGTVSQSNNVPAGALDGRWGAVARVVAENGAQGVVAMLARLGVLE